MKCGCLQDKLQLQVPVGDGDHYQFYGSALNEDALPAHRSALPGAAPLESRGRHPRAAGSIVGRCALSSEDELVRPVGVGGDGVASTGVQNGRVPRARAREERETAGLRRMGGHHRHHHHKSAHHQQSLRAHRCGLGEIKIGRKACSNRVDHNTYLVRN